MAPTRTLFAAVVAMLGFAGAAEALPVVRINSVGYVAGGGGHPATSQPGGTFDPDNTFPVKPHRVVCDYDLLNAAGTVFTKYTNPAAGVIV